MDVAYEKLEKKEHRNYNLLQREGYIHFYGDNAYWSNIKEHMKGIGIGKINSGLASLRKRYAEQLNKKNALTVQTEQNSKLEKILDLSINDLQSLLQSIAENINNEIRKNKDLVNIINQYKNNKTAILDSIKVDNLYNNKQTGEVNLEKMQIIMNAIGNTLKILNLGSTKEFGEFAATYLAQLKIQDRKKSKFYNPTDEGVVKINTNNPTLRKIEEMLNEIPKNILVAREEGKLLSTNSLSSSLSNGIMSGIMGEALAPFIVENLESGVENVKMQAFQTGSMKVTNVSSSKTNAKLDITSGNTTKRIFSSSLYDLTAHTKRHGKNLVIDIVLDSSVKWYQENKKGELISNHIDIHSTGGQTLANLALKIFRNYRYGVYNTLVFHNINSLMNSQNEENKQVSFRILRSAVISNYLEQFLAGTGSEIGDINIADTAVFFMVNGQFYSIMALLTAYLQDITSKERQLKYGNADDLVYMSLGSLDEDIANDWKGNEPSEKAALLRTKNSERQALLKFPVMIKLNKQILKNAIQKTKTQPVM